MPVAAEAVIVRELPVVWLGVNVVVVKFSSRYGPSVTETSVIVHVVCADRVNFLGVYLVCVIYNTSAVWANCNSGMFAVV